MVSVCWVGRYLESVDTLSQSVPWVCHYLESVTAYKRYGMYTTLSNSWYHHSIIWVCSKHLLLCHRIEICIEMICRNLFVIMVEIKLNSTNGDAFSFNSTVRSILWYKSHFFIFLFTELVKFFLLPVPYLLSLLQSLHSSPCSHSSKWIRPRIYIWAYILNS